MLYELFVITCNKTHRWYSCYFQKECTVVEIFEKDNCICKINSKSIVD